MLFVSWHVCTCHASPLNFDAARSACSRACFVTLLSVICCKIQWRALVGQVGTTTRPKSKNPKDLSLNALKSTFPWSDRESDTRFPLLTCASELMGTSAFLNDPKLVISIGIATPKCQFSAPYWCSSALPTTTHPQISSRNSHDHPALYQI